jgi:transaldolase/transaldolase/glucose-6-phosphate isomerase
LSKGGVKAAGTLRRLSEAGIDLDRATQQLEDEGVEKFSKAFDVLLKSLEKKRVAAIR